MRVLRFLLKGKRAHFRRFYTNSSGLTYPVPPPASLKGLLGAALGLGPEYAQRLSGLYLSVRPEGALRHLFQTVNHLFLKGGKLEELRGLHQEGRTQIPLQFLVGKEGNPVAFEAYVAGEEGLVERLKRALEAPQYPLALGPAYALAWVEGVELLEGEVQMGWEGEGIGWWRVEALTLKEIPSRVRLYRDRFPVALGPDRSALRVEELALEAEGKPIPIRYQGEVLVLGGTGVGVVQV